MRYYYKSSLYVLEYLIVPAATVFILGLGIYSISIPGAMEKNYWFVFLGCVAIGGCLIIFTAGGVIKHRPISIEENGVSTYLCGHLFKKIRWSDIRQIERRRYIDPQQGVARYKYSIYGPEGRIWFDDRLQNLRSALDALTGFARKNDIELIEIDAGIDTKMRLNKSDGARTRIQSL
jgi:hypothetical protein